MTASPSRLLIAVSLLSCVCVLGACEGGPLGEDRDEEGTARAGTDSSSSQATTDGGSAKGPATPSGDGRPPSEGVAGGRDAVRETLVVVHPLGRGAIRDEVVVSAKVEARTSVQVFPMLSNLPVTAVHVDEGDRVEQGAVLMELYDTELRLAERTAKTRLAETSKEVERAEHNLEEAQKRIGKSERAAQKARDDFTRLEALVEDGLVNVQEVEDKRLAADDADADLDLARFALIEEALALDLARIKLEQAEIDWERAESDLSHTSVRSAVSGVVAMRDCEVGELSSMSSPAFRVVDLDEPILSLRVPQDALPRLADGQRVDVRAVTDADARFHGVVRKVNPVLDQATGTVHVIVDLERAPGLLPGLFCEARIITASREDALLVDKRAVLYEDDQPVFFALTDDGRHVRKVAFEAGSSTPTAIEVRAEADGTPVAPDLLVVVVGQDSLKDGALVKVREDAY